MSAAHSTPLECENVGIPFSINIALRWSAAVSSVSRICEARPKIEIPLKTNLQQTENVQTIVPIIKLTLIIHYRKGM